MAQENLLALAKLGDVKAIESLINRPLQPKGIIAKVALKEDCLQIMLESNQVPPQQTLLAFIRKGIISLDIASIQTVKVYGKQTGEEFPAWSQDFKVGSYSPKNNSIPGQGTDPDQIIGQTQSNLKERARQGNIDAITQLLNIALQHKNVKAKATIKEECLQVKLECEQIPEKNLLTLVRREMIMLKIKSIKTVKIYGQQKDKDFPDWTQEFELLEPINSQSHTSTNHKQDTSIFNEKTLGILGSILLLIGVFTPIISLPIIGNINYFHNGQGDGVILLVLSLISLVLVFRGEYKLLWWTGGSSFLVIIVGLIIFSTRIYQLQSNVEQELPDNAFGGLVNAAVQSAELQWGWIIIILGASLITGAAAISEEDNISRLGYTKYFYELLKFKKATKQYIFVFLVLLGIFIPKVFAEIIIKNESNNKLTEEYQLVAKSTIGTINILQQGHYLENNNKFASTIEELTPIIQAETDNYKYSIANTDLTQAMAIATATKDNLKSYLGIVYVVNTTELTIGAVCESNSPTKDVSERPQLVAGEIQCPSDYSKLENPFAF